MNEASITIEYVLERAKRCTTYSQFQRNYYALYRWAKANNLVTEVEKILPPVTAAERNVRIGQAKRYPDEVLLEHAKQFPHREAWKLAGEQERRDGNYSHYGAAVKRGKPFVQLCCAHMVRSPKESQWQKYSDQQIIDAAKNYQHRSEWKKGEYGHYQAAHQRPSVLQVATAHMTMMAHPYSGCYSIYAYEFQDGAAYIGLSFQIEKRRDRHLIKGPVFEHQKVCPNYAFQILEDGLPSPTAAAEQERLWITKYRADGWSLLNTSDGGSIGTVTLTTWTKEAVLADALHYDYRTEWLDHSQVAYTTSKRHGWFEEAVAHMPLHDTRTMVGRTVSDEARARMSAAAQIRAADPVWRSNHSATMTNRPTADSTRAAVVAALKGKPHPNGATWARKKQALIDRQTAVVGPLVAQGLSTAQTYEQAKDALGLTRPTAIYQVLERCGLKIPGQVRLDDLTVEERVQRRKDKFKRSYQKHREARIASALARKKMAEAEPAPVASL